MIHSFEMTLFTWEEDLPIEAMIEYTVEKDWVNYGYGESIYSKNYSAPILKKVNYLDPYGRIMEYCPTKKTEHYWARKVLEAVEKNYEKLER